MHGARKAATSVVLTVAMLWPWAAVDVAHPQEPAASDLQLLGMLEMPEGVGTNADPIVGVDHGDGRLYVTHRVGDQQHIAAYDLRADLDVPPLLFDVPVGPEAEGPRSNYRTTVATADDRQTLYMISGARVGGPPSTDPAATIRVLDISDPEHAAGNSETWVLAERGLAGYDPTGITYSERDQRVYLIGEFSGSKNVTAGMGNNIAATPISAPVAMVALDAETGQVAWVRPLPRCQRLVRFSSQGAMIARSIRDHSLYAPCQPGGASSVQWPGQPSLVRFDVSPEADQADAAVSPVEYIPVPGDYSPGDGTAVYDRRADRVYINSLSKGTPGTFVFDAERSAWVGHVAAPNQAFKKLAVDETSGRFYLSGDGFIVTDGVATPPPQARPQPALTEDGIDLDVRHDLWTDPGSNRIFFLADTDEERYDDQIVVVQDTTTTIDPLPLTDHDANTADVPEGPDTFVNYTVVSSGFGALGRLVGGAGNIASYGLAGGQVDPFATLENFGQEAEEPVVVSQGDRTVVAADVPSVHLAAFGATGDAQALATDDGTSGEINEGGTFAADQGAPDQIPADEEDENQDDSTDESEGATVPVTDAAGSPYRKVECSDNGFDDDATERSDSDDVDAGALEGTGAGTGHARVVCDLAGQQSQATASWRAGPAADQAAGPAVAAAEFDTHLSRDPEQGGAGTETVAVASGVELPVPEVGTLHIGEVRATAVTAAAGRPDTTRATWTRILSGVVVTDPDGAQVFPPEAGASSGAGSCATVVTVQSGQDEQRQEADNCRELIEALDAVLQPTVTFELPDPDLAATPLGAYAQVRQTEGDYRNGLTLLGDNSQAVPALQVLVANDGTQKSRLLLHLAAIDTSVIYQIKPCPSCSFNGGTDPDPVPAPTTEPASPTPAATATGQPAVESAAAPPPPPVSLPVQQPEGQSIDLAAAQPSTSEPEVAPQQALSLPGRIGAGLQLLTRDPVQALLVGGVWLLFAGALTTLLRRIRLRQLVSS